MNYGTATEKQISEVVNACEYYGADSIIALAGVPGTGKSFVAQIAAQRFAGDPILVREIQFHPSFSYEEFVEGFRAQPGGGFKAEPGVFLEWNDLALADPGHKFVLLIEEFTRANLPSVLGELLTYIEHRERSFSTIYSRRSVQIAPNLVIVATYNPRDRSALELDEALLRRMRILNFPPYEQQLEEMLRRSMNIEATDSTPKWITKLGDLFAACRKEHGHDFETLMPFGHGIFASVKKEQPDLHLLWKQRIRPIIRRPLVQPHPFADTIEQFYPWRDPEYSVSSSLGSQPGISPGTVATYKSLSPEGSQGNGQAGDGE